MQLIEVTDRANWDSFVNHSEFGHPLQLWGWGEAKRENGWQPHRLLSEDGAVGAQVLLWPIPKTGRFLAYVPRGPVCEPDRAEMLLRALTIWAKDHKALYVRVEPAWTKAQMPPLWVRSQDQIQLPATYTIDLMQTEDELLSSMERKHRQYINKSGREGVVVRRVRNSELGSHNSEIETRNSGSAGADELRSANHELDAMWEIYSDTARRAGFGLHSRHYYDELLRELGANNWLYYAEVEGKPEAFLWLATGGVTAYELYGGVTAAGQAARANYILKWTAIRELKDAEYEVYDFNGRLNEGVSRFKEGFGPTETNWIGTWDYPINKAGYLAWSTLWPVIKPVGRAIRKAVKR